MSSQNLVNNSKNLEELSKNKKITNIKKNKYYDSAVPLISVYTPIYNRINIIERSLNSIKKQDYKNFEYIIIDDGSTDGVENKIYKFMEEVDFPVIYVKKDNGGVHTARNLAIKVARGKYCIGVDSDDELLPNALSIFVSAWGSIPKNKVNKYREVIALCEDENHNVVGNYFPDNINLVDMKTARKLCNLTKGEHTGMNVTKIRKENLFPEPKGVKFVVENIIWRKLDLKYDSYYINKVVRVYHQDGNDHLSKIGQKNIQTVINILYSSWVFLDDRKTYIYSFKEKIMTIIRYQVAKNIIKCSKTEVYFNYKIKDKNIKFFIALLYIPCVFATHIYLNKNRELKEYVKNRKEFK